MKIIFIYPDMARDDKEWTGHYYFGIALLSANAKKEGHKTNLIHITKPINKEQLLGGISKIITSDSIIAFSATTHMFPYVIRWSHWIKNRFDVPVLCGGIHATLNPEVVIHTNGIDIVSVGEGEESLVELCNNLDKKKDITQIKGLLVKKNKKIYRNPVRELIKNLDDLPFADRELFDYKNLYWEKQGIGNFMASKGCPFECTYCCNHAFRKIYAGKGKYVRFRSVDSILKEIKEVIKKYDFIKTILFDDDIFGMDKEWLRQFSKRYKEEIGLPLICNFKATFFDEERAKMLKDAGCIKLKIGLESGNEYILNKVLKRNMSRQNIIDAFRLAKKYGIQIHSFNMVGLPYENVDRILDTIKLNALLRPDVMQISIFYPYEGTQLFELCKKKGFLTDKTSVNYHTTSICNYPHLSTQQIRMFCYYFRQIVWIYSSLFKKKNKTSKFLEGVMDRVLKMKMTAYFSLAVYKPLRSIKKVLVTNVIFGS